MDNRVAWPFPAPVANMPKPARALFAALAHLRCGRLEIVAPGGRSFAFSGVLPGPAGRIELRDWGVCGEILRRGEIGLADTYLAGRWATPDLAAVLWTAAMNEGALDVALHGRVLSRAIHRLRHFFGMDARRRSERNVHARYDLGSGFYQCWLDPTMTYSSGLFADDVSRSLEEAQSAKYERILRLLDPAPDSRILDIGCGWGGFALHAARTRGCKVHGISISRRQLELAQSRAHDAGLSEHVKFELQDYRGLRGTYDAVVSIEMYEVLGERGWPAYFRAIRERLRPGGAAVVQSIAVADERFDRYRSGTDFIQQFIFPRRMLASPSALRRQAERAGLAVRSVHAFGLDYAETLRRWRERFNQAWPEIRAQGLDERFSRLWNFYLCYCEAGFRSRNTDVLQMELGSG